MARKKKNAGSAPLTAPETREERYLAKIAGLVDTKPEYPFTRIERYLDAIADSTGFSPTEAQLAAMNSGATAEKINAIDGKVPKTDVCLIVNGNIAPEKIPIGTYFYFNGQFARAFTNIAEGATIAVGINCDLSSIGAKLVHIAGTITLTFNASGYVDITSTTLGLPDDTGFSLIAVNGIGTKSSNIYKCGRVSGWKIWRVHGTANAEDNVDIFFTT